jgi:hypothetical protein
MHRPIRALAAAAVAAAALLLATTSGCSSSTATSPGKKGGSSASSSVSSPAVAAGDLKIVSPDKVAAKYLTPADVEKVAGIAGVKVVAKDPAKGAGGDINFADGKGLILMVNIGSAKWFANMKTSRNYREAVAGIGDEAFDGPSTEIMATLYQLGFRKSDDVVLLTTFLTAGDPPTARLDQDQLKQLAAIAMSRF